MIINGASRAGGAFFTRHLMRADENEHVSVVEIRGLAAENVRDAFSEMEAVASGTRVQNYFYHANMNTRAEEHLTPEQWEQATDILEQELGLTGQPRFVVEHEKEGRTHRHVIWSRIDADSMTAISDSLTYRKHERAAREIEQEFELEPVESVLVKDRETERPERRPQDWESFRGQASDIDPHIMKEEITALWHAADSGQSFKAALEDAGYILAKGDRRDFCIIDQAGDEHSLARRLSGPKAAEIRVRMADLDRDSLPSVAQARELALEEADATTGGASSPPTTPAPAVQSDTAEAPSILAPADAPVPAAPDITLPVASDMTASFDGLQPIAPGELVPIGDPVPPGTLPADTSGSGAAREAADEAAPARVTAWGSAWRAFSDRAAALADHFYGFIKDETSGKPEAERSWAARVFDAGRHVAEGLDERNATFLPRASRKPRTLRLSSVTLLQMAREVTETWQGRVSTWNHPRRTPNHNKSRTAQ